MRYSSLLALAAFAGNAAAAKAPAAYSACECVSNKRCWGLVMSGYAELVPLAKREIEGSFPNRFSRRRMPAPYPARTRTVIS